MLFAKSTGGLYDETIHKGAIPNDALPIPDELYQQFRNGEIHRFDVSAGLVVRYVSPPPTVAEIIATYTAAIQKRLDDFARTRNYDGILSAATYATSAVPKFKAEGQYAVEARDATWAKGYEILAAVEAGTRPLPTLEGLAAELPALAWPK
jgi:hypothetical protein